MDSKDKKQAALMMVDEFEKDRVSGSVTLHMDREGKVAKVEVTKFL